jgi:hypothetical protein
MLKPLLTAIALAMVLFAATGYTKDGELELVNLTNAPLSLTVEGDKMTVEANSFASKTWKLSKTIFSVEEKSVYLSGKGLFKFYFSRSAGIKAGEIYRIEIKADAGALEIDNLSNSHAIERVYIAPQSRSFWGNNALRNTLKPGYYYNWTIKPGLWKVLVVDDRQNGYIADSVKTVINRYVVLQWTPLSTNFMPETVSFK